MAVTSKFYGPPIRDQYGGTAGSTTPVNWMSDTIKVALTTSSYTPNQDTDDFFNDVTNELSTAGGYTSGGASLGSKSCTYDTTSNEARLDAADTAWSSASFTARNAVVYKSTGTASTSPLVSYIDFGGDETVASGTFTITYDSTGVAKLTAS